MSTTPLSDFLYLLSDPAELSRFRADPGGYCADHRLPPELQAAVLQMHGGRLRVTAMRELEEAGLAPLVTDKLPVGASASPEINIYPENTTTTENFPEVHTIEVTYPSNYTTDYTTVIQNTQIASESEGLSGSYQMLPARERVRRAIEGAIAYGEAEPSRRDGSLVIVGSGIRSIVDMTRGAEAQVRVADRVFYTVADPVTEKHLHDLNPHAVSLYDLYGNDKPRIETYRAMVDRMLESVRQGLNVCGVFYGHPGVFAWPTHEAVRLARLEGYRAEMFPGVSADACLFADLGIDPANVGYQTFEATELLINQRSVDSAAHVVVWQVECVGDAGFNFAGYRRHNFDVLTKYLRGFYADDHDVIVYEASMYPHLPPIIKRRSFATIGKDDLTGISTLYIPPLSVPTYDSEMAVALGLRAATAGVPAAPVPVAAE